MRHFIDIVKLSQQQQRLSGILPLTALPRVMQALYREHYGELHYCLDFATTDSGEALIRGIVEVDVILQCQRCLAAMEWPIKTKVQVIVVESADGEGNSVADSTAEVWSVANLKHASLMELIADELILALPFMPLHVIAKRETTVLPSTSESANSLLNETNDYSDLRESPFAVLAQLPLNE